MSYIPNIPESSTSAYNINSYSATTGGGWSGDIFTGAGEQNDYNYVSVNLQVDTGGTLTFQFSQDGVNWSSYPTTQFTIVSGINEIHGAFKGTRWVRPVFTATGPGRTYFRLRTMYSYSPVTLTAPLNQSIGADQDATIVRAVGIGENPSGSYVNQKIDGVGFQTTDDLASGATYNSAILSTEGYTQLQTHIVSSNNGTLGFKFCSIPNCSGTTVGENGVERYISLPYTSSGGFQLYSAPVFTPYVQYSFTNTGTGTTTQLFYETKLLTKALSGQLLGLNASIASSMVANLGRNVIVGQNPSGTYTNTKQDGVAFSTTTPLSGTGVYSSDLISTDGFSQIETQIYSNQSGTLVGRWYSDSNGTELIRTFTRPYTGTELSGTSYFSSPVFGPYLRYTYTNGSTAQSSFFLSFNLRTKSISGQVIGVNDFIPSGVVANLGRNVIVGQDVAGNFRNVGVDSEGHMRVNMDEPLTAFGEMAVAEPTPVTQLDFVYGINNQMVTTTTTNGGTVTSVDGNIVVTTSAVTNSMVIASSKRYAKYRDGQGTVGRFTALFTSGVTGNNQYAGLGTPNMSDGYFFGYSGTTFGIIHDSSGTTVGFYPQTQWNEDTMDGSRNEGNPSGQLIDPTKGNVYQIKMQYLGYGNIFFYVETTDAGELVNVHNIKYANTSTKPSLRQPSLNLIWASENTTNNTEVSVRGASGALFNEGKVLQLGPKNAFDNNKATITTLTNIFSLKNATTYNNLTNRSQIRLKTISVAYDGANGVGVLQVHKNPTVAGGGNFITVNGTTADSGTTITNGQSIVSTDITGGAVTTNTNSFVVFNVSLSRNTNIISDVSDLDIYLNPGEIMVFACKATVAGTFSVSVNWTEDI